MFNVKQFKKYKIMEIIVCEKCQKTVSEVFPCERCDTLVCNECTESYNQFTQIDYTCCKSCAEPIDRDNY